MLCEMASAPCRTLKEVYEQASTPPALIEFMKEIHIESIADLVGYVEKEHFEKELRELVEGKFLGRPPVEARAAVEASDGGRCQPSGASRPRVRQRPTANPREQNEVDIPQSVRSGEGRSG